MLLVGVLLTACWISLFNWSKRTPSAPATAAVSVHGVQAPAALAPVLSAREARAANVIASERRHQAANALGLLHYLPFPLFALLGAACFDALHSRYREESSVACSRVAMAAMVLCGVGATMVAWRLAYVPLVDWIWEACGGQMVDYERNHSRKSRGRRTGGSLDGAYQFGITLAIAAWVLVAWLYSHQRRANKRAG